MEYHEENLQEREETLPITFDHSQIYMDFYSEVDN